MTLRSASPRARILLAFLALLGLKVAALGALGVFGGEDAHAQAAAPAAAQPAAAQTPTAPEEVKPAPAREPSPGQLDLEILRDVERRQKELDAREEALAREKERLEAMKGDLDKQIAELKALEVKLEEQIKLRGDLEDGAIQKLAKTYSAMPPETAALLVAQMDTRIAIRVLSAMKERNAGRILAATPPALASRLSEGLVKRK